MTEEPSWDKYEGRVLRAVRVRRRRTPERDEFRRIRAQGKHCVPLRSDRIAKQSCEARNNPRVDSPRLSRTGHLHIKFKYVERDAQRGRSPCARIRSSYANSSRPVWDSNPPGREAILIFHTSFKAFQMRWDTKSPPGPVSTSLQKQESIGYFYSRRANVQCTINCGREIVRINHTQ